MVHRFWFVQNKQVVSSICLLLARFIHSSHEWQLYNLVLKEITMSVLCETAPVVLAACIQAIASEPCCQTAVIPVEMHGNNQCQPPLNPDHRPLSPASLVRSPNCTPAISDLGSFTSDSSREIKREFLSVGSNCERAITQDAVAAGGQQRRT